MFETKDTATAHGVPHAPSVGTTGVDPAMTAAQAYQFTNGELKPHIPRTAWQFMRAEWKVLAYIFGSIFAPVVAGILLYIIPATKGEQAVLRSDMIAADALTRTELTGSINTTKAELTGQINTVRAELNGKVDTANAKLEAINANTTELLRIFRQPKQPEPQPAPAPTLKASAAPAAPRKPRPAVGKKVEPSGPLSWLTR